MAEPAAIEPPVFARVAIVGLGLIGASMALAARRGGREPWAPNR